MIACKSREPSGFLDEDPRGHHPSTRYADYERLRPGGEARLTIFLYAFTLCHERIHKDHPRSGPRGRRSYRNMTTPLPKVCVSISPNGTFASDG